MRTTFFSRSRVSASCGTPEVYVSGSTISSASVRMSEDSGVLHVERGGDGPLLVLLHGLGATGEVWDGVVKDWHGSWLVPDLPGHGRSEPIERYSFGSFAAAVAEVIPREPVVIVGHSLGGVVALALASGWFGVEVTNVVGIGIKVRWTDEELAKAASLAARPGKVFASQDEAVER